MNIWPKYVYETAAMPALPRMFHKVRLYAKGHLRADPRRKIDFVIGGTQKGGTSALNYVLQQHPQICMPYSKKELHYFDDDKHFRRRPAYWRYHAHFLPESQHRIIGEATPIYMYWNAAPYRIWSYNPNIKWILVLRNPIERAFSAWNMETKRGKEHLPFKDAVEQEVRRCREALPAQHRIFSYIDRGFYAHQVRRIHNIFGEKNCRVILNEDLRANHKETVATVLEFLNVDSSTVPPPSSSFSRDYNEPIDPVLYRGLVDMFYFDIKRLEQLIRRDLSTWYSGRSEPHGSSREPLDSPP